MAAPFPNMPPPGCHDEERSANNADAHTGLANEAISGDGWPWVVNGIKCFEDQEEVEALANADSATREAQKENIFHNFWLCVSMVRQVYGVALIPCGGKVADFVRNEYERDPEGSLKRFMETMVHWGRVSRDTNLTEEVLLRSSMRMGGMGGRMGPMGTMNSLGRMGSMGRMGGAGGMGRGPYL